MVSSHVEQFIRGLIHSDGTRIIATERKGKNVRYAPRYAFSNRSEDILRLFAGPAIWPASIGRGQARTR